MKTVYPVNALSIPFGGARYGLATHCNFSDEAVAAIFEQG
jgi:hypothetical protein